MSIKITVSWRFMPPGQYPESGSSYVDVWENTRRNDTSPMSPVFDRVLPLGSSVVAPGLAVLMPA
jgi:hypothetical protein